MPAVIPQNDPWAGVGGAFGKGMGDQAPQEFDRYRLSQGLQNMKTEGQTPMQLAAQLYQASYDRPDIAQGLMPYAMQEARRSQYQQQHGGGAAPQGVQPLVGGGGMVVPEGAPGGQFQPPQQAPSINVQSGPQARATQGDAPQMSPGAQAPVGAPQAQPTQLVSKQGEQQLLRPIIPMSEDQKRQQTSQMLSQNPYLSPEEAYDYVNKQDESRMDQMRAVQEQVKGQTAVKNSLDEKMKDIVSKKLEMKPEQFAYKGFSGELYNDVLRKAEDAVARGELTVDQAAQKYSNEINDVYRGYQNLKNVASSWPFSDKQKLLNVSNLNNIRQKYEKHGRLRDYEEELRATMGLSPEYASYLAYPPSKQIKGALTSTKKLSPFGSLPSTREKYANQLIDKISKDIKPSDRIYSIAMEATKNNLPFNEFMQDLQRRYQEGSLQLTKEQADQLEVPVSSYPGLNDLFYFSWLDLDKVSTALPED